MTTPETIIFAIQSALKLGKAIQQSYVDATRNRPLVLPLPDFDSGQDAATAYTYFQEHTDYRPPGLQEVIERLADTSTDSEQRDHDEKKILEFYYEARLATLSDTTTFLKDGTSIDTKAVSHMVTIRQWQRGAPGQVTPLQRVAGSILEIAVDYYAHTPGAFNDQSTQGKALRVLLTAIDDITFSDTPLHDLPELFVVATIESLSENASTLSGNKETQNLIKVTASALAKDVKIRIDAIKTEPGFGAGDIKREKEIISWAEVVFRSVLSSGSKVVVQDPKKYLGIDDEGTSALVNHVGVAVLDFVLAQPKGQMGKAFGKEGIDVMVKAALTAVGEHPEIITKTNNNQGLTKLLSETATQLSQMDSLVAPGTLPEVVRIVLEKTGRNMTLIWPDQGDPKKHLLLIAASETLSILTTVEPGAKWTPTFGKDQLLEIVDHVLEEFIQNPGWLVDTAGKKSDTLKVVLQSVIEVLRQKGDQRLSPETGIEILRVSLNAVSLHKKLLTKVDGGQLAIAALIDTAISKIFNKALDDTVTWSMVRHEVIIGLITRALNAAGKATDDSGKTAISKGHIAALATELDQQFVSLSEGKPFDLEALMTSVEEAIENP